MNFSAVSWLMPGTWLENARVAAESGLVRGMELLFFRYDADARAILARELAGLAALSDSLSFTVHLPDPLSEADADLVDALSPIASGFVMHPPEPDGEGAWRELARGLRERHGDRFALEFTAPGPFARALSLVPDLPVCADTGALLRAGLDPADWIGTRAASIRELHLHAARDGRDHLPPTGDEAWLPRTLELAETRGMTVVLEVFSMEKLVASLAAVESARDRAANRDSDASRDSAVAHGAAPTNTRARTPECRPSGGACP